MTVPLKEMNGPCEVCSTEQVKDAAKDQSNYFVTNHVLSRGGHAPSIDVSSMIKRMPSVQPVSA